MILISLFRNLVNEPTWCSIKYAFRLKRFEQMSQTYSLAEEEEDAFFLASFLHRVFPHKERKYCTNLVHIQSNKWPKF